MSSIFLKSAAYMKSALEAIGFDASKISADTPADLEAHIETLTANAVAEQTEKATQLESELTAAKELLDASTASNETQGNQLSAFSSGLTAAGVKLEATADAAAITKAVNDRASIVAQEILAAQGHAETLLSDTAQITPAKPSQENTLTGRDRTIAHWKN